MNNLISAKVKFNRNLKDFKFITNSTKSENTKVLNLCLKAMGECDLKAEKLDNINTQIIDSLIQSEKIENDFAINLSSKGYASNDNAFVQINNKNHIEIFSSDTDIFSAYSNAKKVDKMLCNKLHFAYSDKFGFLSPSIKNIGSGMSVECKVMLPALNKINTVKNLPRVNEKLRFEIECLDAKSGLYLISNNENLGYTEKQICELTYSYLDKIIKLEIQTSKALASDDIDEILDSSLRAKAILKNCLKISPNEVNLLISNILIAINAEVENELGYEKVNKLLNELKLFKNQKELAENIQKIIK